MSGWRYRALTADGRSTHGVIQADSARGARQQLRERGLSPLQLEAVAQAGRPGLWQRISSAELALLTRELATLIQAAVPVEQALHVVAQQSRREVVRGVLLAVRESVLQGQALAAALNRFPQSFPAMYRHTVAAGERGQLGRVLEQLADHVEQSEQARARLQVAMVYPAILVLVSLAVVAFLLGHVVPSVIGVFTASGQVLPLPTRLLLLASAGLQAGWPLLLLAVAAVGGGWVWLRRQPQWRLRLDGVLLRVPLLGPLLRQQDSTRFTATLAILENSGVPLVEALAIATRVVGNAWLQDGLGRAAERVRQGSGLAVALQAHAPLQPMLMHLIGAGESSGRLGQMLQRGAQQQQQALNSRIGLLVGLFEPLVLVVMGGLVLLIVLAVVLPIIGLNQMV